MNALVEVEKVSNRIAAGNHESIKPGDPVHITAGRSAGDAVRQGDVYVVVCDDPPEGYAKTAKKGLSRQLAVGDTKGSRHVLDSFVGVEVWLPANWGTDESLSGPFLRCKEERVIDHPEHGAIHIAAGLSVLIEYQRNYDKEIQAERRARD